MDGLDDLLSAKEPDDPDELSIVTVLRYYGADKIPSGYGWKSMRCPFKQLHKDSRASASVNRGKNRFRCHACGTAGNPIGIIMKLEGLTYKEACEQAANIFGESIPTVSRPTHKHFKRPSSDGESWCSILG